MNGYRAPTLCAYALACVVPACGSDPPVPGGGGAGSDSVIVHDQRALWPGGRGWSVSSPPLLQIGRADGSDDAYRFSAVVHALRRRAGGFVVADGASRQIRLFNREGRSTRVVGGRGGGPGEFSDLTSLMRGRADSLLAYDRRLDRLSVFAPDGTLVRTRHLAGSGNGVVRRPLGVFDDGSLLISEWRVPVEADHPAGTTLRDTLTYSRIEFRNGDRMELDTIAEVPGPVRYAHRIGRVWAAHRLPYSPEPVVALDRDGVYLGPADQFSIRYYDLQGDGGYLIRLEVTPELVTANDMEGALERRVTGSTDEHGRPFPSGRIRRFWERVFNAMPTPETKPTYGKAVLDASENLWVREYGGRSDAEIRWWVFNPAGRLLGTVHMPARFRVTEIGEDYVLGVGYQRFDVETVQLYRLDKPA